MDQKKKFRMYLLLTCLCVAMLFVWIGVAVLLTGGRDTSEFTRRDWQCFWVVAVLWVGTMGLSFFFDDKAGKTNPNRPQMPKLAKWEKITATRGFFLALLGFAGAMIVTMVGIRLRVRGLLTLNLPLLLGLSLAALLMVPLNVLLCRSVERRLQRMSVAEMRDYLLSHREQAEQTAREKYRLLRLLRILLGVYTLLLAIGAAGIALQAGTIANIGTCVCFALLAAGLAAAVTTRIRFAQPKQLFTDAPNFIHRGDYPLLYGAADRAAKAVGCTGKIQLSLEPDFTGSITVMGEGYVVSLGVLLLNALTEQEVYSVLCHEFAHVTQENGIAVGEARFRGWVNSARNPHFSRKFSESLFRFFYEMYEFQYSLFDFASALHGELEADRVMMECAGPESAGSALTKLFYGNLCSWEQSMTDEPPIYRSEQAEYRGVTASLKKLREETPRRKADWDAIARKEIQSRNASHPTVAQRIERMGAEPGFVLPYPDSGDFYAECRKALDYVEELILKNWSETYAEERKTEYLEPLELVSRWEQEGEPIAPETYADVVDALAKLGRFSDAAALCSRVIEAYSGSAVNTALYFRGSYRLYQYDDGGLEDLAQSMDNPNFVESAMDRIGEYCFLMGREDDVEDYRQRSVEMAQRQRDEYDELSLLRRKDRLTAEQLPEGMLEQILTFIRSVDQDSLEKVYLVRKTISDSFFSSVFVLRFRPETPEVLRNRVYHLVFRYLDAMDWQFSLFTYEDLLEVKVEKIENSCVYSAE